MEDVPITTKLHVQFNVFRSGRPEVRPFRVMAQDTKPFRCTIDLDELIYSVQPTDIAEWDAAKLDGFARQATEWNPDMYVAMPNYNTGVYVVLVYPSSCYYTYYFSKYVVPRH